MSSNAASSLAALSAGRIPSARDTDRLRHSGCCFAGSCGHGKGTHADGSSSTPVTGGAALQTAARKTPHPQFVFFNPWVFSAV